MKKSIIILILTCVFAKTFAQHIDFLGIPLGQPIKAFERSLLAKGFTYSGEPGTHTYKGEFWKYNLAYLVVEVENGRAVGVLVAPLRSDFDDLNRLVYSLQKKYGKYTTKNGNEYWWKVRGGDIKASYNNSIGIQYNDRTSRYYINRYHKRNYEDDL